MRRSGLLLPLLVAGCASTSTSTSPSPSTTGDHVIRVETGEATFYGRNHHGGPTASGEKFNMWAFTAAHRTLKMNTRVRVTNLSNGRSVVVRINDRGPYGPKRERIIDLSYAAAQKLDMIERGVIPVRLEVLGP